jgi:AAA ATPase domain
MGRPTTIRQPQPERPAVPLTTVHGDAALFSGRQHELDALDGVLGEVVLEGSRVVLVEGPAGIGKTALLRRFVDRHSDLRVFWSSGGESGRSSSFAVIARLFRFIGVRGYGSPVHTASALPEEKAVEVGRRLVQALTGLDRARPTVLVIDDAHGADRDSLRALLFAVRRLSDHPVMTVVVTRPGAADLPEGLVRLAGCARTGSVLPLGPMLPGDVQDLAAAVGVPDLPLRAAYRLCAHTVGNPRHLLALLAELPVEAWSRELVLPAPRLFSRSVGRTLSSCSDEARRLVEAVSVLGEHADLATAAAIADVDEPLVALEEACDAGLLLPPQPDAAWRLTFPDPLVRAAVNGQLGSARRARLHVAASDLDEQRSAPGPSWVGLLP